MKIAVSSDGREQRGFIVFRTSDVSNVQSKCVITAKSFETGAEHLLMVGTRYPGRSQDGERTWDGKIMKEKYGLSIQARRTGIQCSVLCYCTTISSVAR